jgi:hemolysin activation/secretion protein
VKLEVRHVPLADLMLYAFYDRAHVSNANPDQPVLGGDTAVSFGVGVRYIYRRLTSYLELAQPLARDVASEGNRNVRLFGGLRYSF